MPAFLSVTTTTASREDAEAIARAVVTERLAACATILPDVHSIYRWQGKVEEGREVMVMMKTSADKFEVLKKRIKSLHPYDCPCIIAEPIVAGDDAYLTWMEESL